jgi:transcriptional regulator with XRE-family HTH domain
VRAARALLRWTRAQLATKANVSAETVKNFEIKGTDPLLTTAERMRHALERAGVEFLDPVDGRGEGVRFRSAASAKGSRARSPRPQG